MKERKVKKITVFIIKTFNKEKFNWEEIFASAKPMKFNAFNTGRITGKIKTYSVTTSFSENVDINVALDCDLLAFSFRQLINNSLSFYS